MRINMMLIPVVIGITILFLLTAILKAKDDIVISVVAGGGGTVNEIPFSSYEPNTEISICAVADTGYCFDRWTQSDGGVFADIFSAQTTFITSDTSSVATAHFKPIQHGSQSYYLIVTAGKGGTIPAGLEQTISGFYEQGEKILVPVRSMQGYIFDRWTSSDGGYFDDESIAESEFTMPGNSTTVTATFKRKPMLQRKG